MRPGIRSALLTSCVLATSISLALAQENNEDPSLEEVLVTAQKRVENTQEVPMAVSHMSTEQVENLTASGADIRFLRGRLPSLQVESSFGRTFPRFYIRGYGNTDFDLNASQPVSLVYDEVVMENPILKGFPAFDLARIEMLRGPQGTLFGRNTPAGIVKLESAKPSQEFEALGKISYGSFDTINLEGALNGALSENWSGRISALYNNRGDWVDNGYTGEKDAYGGHDEKAVRLQAGFDNSENVSMLFNVHARSLDGTARLFRANIIEPGSNNLVAGFDRDTVYIDGANSQELDTFGAQARLEWDLGNMTLTSVTAYESGEVYSRGDIDGGYGASFLPDYGPGFIPFSSESADAVPDLTQFTQEIRLSSNDWDGLNWQAGFFLFNEDLTIESFSYDSLFGGAQNGYAIQHQETDAWAIFGSIDYDFSEATSLRAGLRYSDDSKDFDAERFESPLAFLGVGPIGPLYAEVGDSEVSWDVSLYHAMSEDVNVYARVARGFRAPSIQGRILFGDIVSVAESETVLSIEGGVKSTLMDDRLRLNASLFSYTVDNPQLTAVGGENNFNTLINADEAQGQGFELEMEAVVTQGLQLTAGLSYNDTEIKDSTLAIQPCGGGCTVLDPAGPIEGTVLIGGNQLPHAPKWIANATVRWSTDIASGELYVLGDWFYRGEENLFLYEAAEFNVDSMSELGLRIGYRWDSGQQEVALFGRNITDETALVGGIDFNNLTGFVNEPAFWGLEYSARF